MRFAVLSSVFMVATYLSLADQEPVVSRFDQSGEDTLLLEVNKLISGSNVTMRRDIEKVYQLADRYVEEGRIQEAIDLLRRALTVDARNLESQIFLAELLQREGETSEAMEVAERIYDVAESPALLKRIEALNPNLPSDGGTNFVWNHGNQPLEGLRIVLIPVGESPTIMHRELADLLNKYLELPVILKTIDLPLKTPERNTAAGWLSSLYMNMARDLTPEQRALLGVDLDVFLDVAPGTSQKISAMEAYFRLQPELGEKASKKFHDTWEEQNRYVQYDGRRILAELKEKYVALPGELVLGVVAGDLFSGKANYIFSTFRPPYACMSFVRYMGNFYDSAEFRPRVRERMMKTAVWSSFAVAGHSACSSPYCMRTYVHSLEEEDELTNELCSTCRKLWQQYLHDKGVK